MRILFYTAITLFLFTACSESSRTILPRVSGKAGEVLIITDKSVWNGAIGDSLRSYLSAPYMVLPQMEPNFDLIQVPPAAFTDIFKSHRNIVFVSIKPGSSAQLLMGNDKWARPQSVFELNAPTAADMLSLLPAEAPKLARLLSNTENRRLMDLYAGNRNLKIAELLSTRYSIDLIVPASFSLDVDSGNFVWISEETGGATLGVLVYTYPYTDKNTFTKNYLLNKRAEFTRKYVPGASQGSYMATESSVPAGFKTYLLKNKAYTAELRGLWRMENGFMGGPYINISTPDTLRKRIVSVDAFVFAPNIEKRNYMRQLESILYSLQIKP